VQEGSGWLEFAGLAGSLGVADSDKRPATRDFERERPRPRPGHSAARQLARPPGWVTTALASPAKVLQKTTATARIRQPPSSPLTDYIQDDADIEHTGIIIWNNHKTAGCSAQEGRKSQVCRIHLLKLYLHNL
jgi:hypothetical protein